MGKEARDMWRYEFIMAYRNDAAAKRLMAYMRKMD